MPTHITLDLETLDNTSTSVILQLGAVAFDPAGASWTSEFKGYCNDLDGSVSLDTFKWWLTREQDARKALAEGLGGTKCGTTKSVITAFAAWAKSVGAEAIWSHGATFDIPIVKQKMSKYRVEAPWKFWSEYDTRTLYYLKGKTTIKPQGVYHDALDDAKYQALCVQEVYQR